MKDYPIWVVLLFFDHVSIDFLSHQRPKTKTPILSKHRILAKKKVSPKADQSHKIF